MRSNPVDRLRKLGAAVMVAAYALGVLAPAVAFARADRASIVHVLSESHDGMLILHFHEGGSNHHDQQPAKSGSGPVHHCCGVVSMPGLAPMAAVVILAPQTTQALLPPTEAFHDGCSAARLERPPNSSLTA